MKQPHTLQSVGAAEQLALIPEPPFCPRFPEMNSAAMRALKALMHGAINQVDWLIRGYGWRLAAAIKELDYLGWQPRSVLRYHAGCRRRIAYYTLHAEALRTARTRLRRNG